MDSSHTSTTCMVRVADQRWRSSEVSLGARSLLVRAVDGSAPVEWLPYDDVADVTEVDDAGTAQRFIEVQARDGRRLAMQLGPEMLASLLAAISNTAGRPEDPMPRPAGFGIGSTAVPPPGMFSATPSAEPATDPAATAPPEPLAAQHAATEPPSAGTGRRWLLLGALLIVVALGAVVAVVLSGDEIGPDPAPAGPSTDSPDLQAEPEPDDEVRSATTVPADPVEDGPESALSVGVEDVVVDTGGDSPAIYLAFDTTNETARNVGAYDVEVDLTTTDAEGREISWPVQFRCTSPLSAEGTRTGSFAEQAPGADIDALVDCRVAAWPIDAADPAQSGFTREVTSGAAWNAEVRVVTVEFTDGTVLD